MFKILGYDAEEQRWVCVSKHAGYEQAHAAYFVATQLKTHMWVAMVQIRIQASDGQDQIEIHKTDAPHPERLVNAEVFRKAALAK